MMHVTQADTERCAQSTQQAAPQLVLQMLELIADHRVAVVVLQLPGLRQRDQQVMAEHAVRCADQLAYVPLRAAATPVQDMQHTSARAARQQTIVMRQSELADGTQR